MSGQPNQHPVFEPVHVGERFPGIANWGVMVRTRDTWKLVCVGCTKQEADELVRHLNANQSHLRTAPR